MAYTIELSPAARRDIANLLDYLVPEAGEAVARSYVARLHSFLRGFDTFPKRGTVRSDFRPGLRIVGFERSASIAFVVKDDTVVILRIFQRGQDLIFDEE